MISETQSGLESSLEIALIVTEVRARIAWSAELQWTNLSPGSDWGKKTQAGRPLTDEGSNRKPTEINNSRQPRADPTLFSIDCKVVYIAFLYPRWMRWSDFSTKCKITLKASRDRSGLFRSDANEEDINATFESKFKIMFRWIKY